MTCTAGYTFLNKNLKFPDGLQDFPVPYNLSRISQNKYISICGDLDVEKVGKNVEGRVNLSYNII